MKAKFGAIVVDGRGKINGFVASKNRAGAYFRTKVTPVNPQTSYQVTSRANMSAQSQAWRGLTDAQRTAWNAAVSSFKSTDIFGDIKNPSGFNLFVKINTNLATISASTLTSPPLPSEVPYFTTFSATAAAGTPALSITFAAAIAATEKVILFATAPQSPGKKFVKSEFRKIGVLTNADTSPKDALSLYTAKFGSIGTAGQKIFLKAVQIQIATGIRGLSRECEVVIAA